MLAVNGYLTLTVSSARCDKRSQTLSVLPGWAKVTALCRTTSPSRSPCLPGARKGALPRLSAPGRLLFHRHVQVPGAVGGHTILSFPARCRRSRSTPAALKSVRGRWGEQLPGAGRSPFWAGVRRPEKSA